MASNNLITPWIAAHVELCLGFYIGQTLRNDIEVTDDGASLIFHVSRSSFSALVAEWALGPSSDGLVLIDSENQIEAFISKELLAASDWVSSIPKSPKKHRIELLDFSLVIPYSAPCLDVRLCINRFCIDWEGKEHRFTPKRKLVKNLNIKGLLDKALQKTRDSRRIHLSAEIDNVSAKSSQPHVEAEPDQDNPSVSQIFSQVPASQHVPPVDDYKAGSSLLRTGASLLQHLNPFSTSSTKTIASPNETLDRPVILTANEKTSPETLNYTNREVYDKRQASTESQTGDNIAQDCFDTGAQNQSSGNLAQKKSLANISSQSLHQPAENVPQNNEGPVEVNHTTSQSPSRKRRRGSPGGTAISDVNEGLDEQVSDDHPPKKKQKPDSMAIVPQISPSHTTPDTVKKSTDKDLQSQDTHPNSLVDGKARRANPWKWSGQIPLREVLVPKDQSEMLENPTKRRWIPSAVGVSLPPGHVPALLLSRWNSIAERRHRSVQEKQASPERPVTPDPASSSCDSDADSDTESEQVPWSPSPPRDERAIQLLPADSSPLKEKSPERRQQFLEKTEGENRVSPHGGADAANNSQQPENVQNDDSQGFQQTPIPESPAKENYTSAAITESPRHFQKEQPKDPDIGLLTMSEIEYSTQESIAQKQRSSSVSKNNPSPPAREIDPDAFDSGDESDESMMDTSVPFALGGSLPEPSQSTQNEQEPISSGPPLPVANARQVQVFETPAMNNSRSSHALAAKDTSQPAFSNGAPFSARQNQSSSQSRVVNTYPFHGSHEQTQTQSSNEGSHSSIPSNGSVQVKRTQPQSSNQDLMPQNPAQDQSPSEVVLDSSGPAQRHQNDSQSSSNPITESSHQSASSHQPATSQPMQQTQDSMAGLSSHDHSGGSQISPLARFIPAATDHGSIFNEGKRLPLELNNSSEDIPSTQSAELIARRLGYLNKPMESFEAHVFYDKFRREYKHYNGDFGHFSELCLKLKSIRAGGQLQRSFLWDDFIIMHLNEYLPHVEQQSSQGTAPMGYEKYFLLCHTNPVHKKRCLTLPAIDSAASQALSTKQGSQITSDQSPRIPGDSQTGLREVSLTASLVNQFANFHAHSFNDTSPSCRPPSNIEADQQSSILQSPNGLPAVDINIGTSPYFVRQSSVEIKQEHSDELTEGLTTRALPLSSYENSTLVKQEQDAEEPYALGSYIANTQETRMEPSQEVQEESSEESAEDESRHETASVELGDEMFTSKATSAVPFDKDTIPETDSEAESEEENWFLALRRSRIPVPAWSDDPNTPFKRWAEADQNALIDRRRRGGSKILLDDKGVIRRPIHR
ncbi:uncharacterized protein N7469_003990 [Penicillium citrinum]|uniref:Telomere replication protein EST3 n=1 Tax=Penicillium citrinum TaxID=5077 RepID=A0A9W9P681_PENCI|nr:uncharacterized protein N7469_003990 [Penicillium citrinum]KAJ5234822.1 hypothetical protein N7469_003990 [Penicillium citrinum]